uniref:Secreted protein n=1 Tax=Cacopsylla melanoneura TaxID=428564 RepID=A0A8D8RTC6_9HEMI
MVKHLLLLLVLMLTVSLVRGMIKLHMYSVPRSDQMRQHLTIFSHYSMRMLYNALAVTTVHSTRIRKSWAKTHSLLFQMVSMAYKTGYLLSGKRELFRGFCPQRSLLPSPVQMQPRFSTCTQGKVSLLRVLMRILLYGITKQHVPFLLRLMPMHVITISLKVSNVTEFPSMSLLEVRFV